MFEFLGKQAQLQHQQLQEAQSNGHPQKVIFNLVFLIDPQIKHFFL